MSSAQRADLLLVAQGLCDSRSRAQALIKAGHVFAGDVKVEKPSEIFADDVVLRLEGQDHPWVSRGGMKLAKALEDFGLDPSGVVAIDVGASTGGFTDVLLQHGAAKVYAVDVGSNQMVQRLREDPRVVNLENTNARWLNAQYVPEPADWVVCDASFIGLELVLPAALALTKPQALLVALIKPQFEVGKGRVGKNGVVSDPALHQEVCDKITSWINGLEGWKVTGLTDSPILGPAGNREFLICARRQG